MASAGADIYRMALLLYNLLLPVAMLVYLPVFVYKLVRRGNFLHHFGERFGLYTSGQRAAVKRLRAPVWVHAVSVGEVQAAIPFIRRWQQRQPDLDFVLSVTTTTGYATAQAKLPERVKLIYSPLDFPTCVRAALRLVRPRLLVIFEVEIWPNLITMASRAGTPVVLVNGRMSDRSARGYAKHSWFFRPLLARFSRFCMQSDEDARRVKAVVGEHPEIHVCHNMKFDLTPDVASQDKRPLLDAVFGPGERLVWTAGSTHPGEETLVVNVFLALQKLYPQLRLVLVPRHHERAGEAEAVLRERGLSYRLLKLPSGTEAPAAAPCHVLLVNTTGELMAFYAACDIAYVGKSLGGNHGGHNIIEPAMFSKPVIHGCNMENFRLVADIFRKQQAVVEVARDSDLEPAMKDLLESAATRAELGRRARQVIEENRGAIDKTLALLEPLMKT